MLVRNAGNNKVVGKVKGETYCKSVLKSKHLFKKYNGYAISREVVDLLKEQGVKTIILSEKENKEKFTISLDDFITKGKVINFGDEQICLDIYYWRKE